MCSAEPWGGGGSVTAHGDDKSKGHWMGEQKGPRRLWGKVATTTFFILIILHPSRDSLALWDF